MKEATMKKQHRRCTQCDGEGRVVRATEFMFNGTRKVYADCPVCYGLGYWVDLVEDNEADDEN
jgi:DnaJ-class molecular chaperone